MKNKQKAAFICPNTEGVLRNAQGNVLAIYQKKDNNFTWKSPHLYGSSRLGIWKAETRIQGTYKLNVAAMQQSVREYELTNHLGNVLSTITDKGVITSAQDYYPFGLTLASRSFTEGGSSYRYSFNGKENDKETGLQDYGMRLYLKKLGRFPTVDPLTQKFPELTPYQFASNTPISGIDLDGLEVFVITKRPPEGGGYEIVPNKDGIEDRVIDHVEVRLISATSKSGGLEVINECTGVTTNYFPTIMMAEQMGESFSTDEDGVMIRGVKKSPEYVSPRRVEHFDKVGYVASFPAKDGAFIPATESYTLVGDFNSSKADQTRTITLPASSTPINLSIAASSIGEALNNFNIFDASGTRLSPTITTGGAQNFTVPAGTVISVTVLADPVSTGNDQYRMDIRATYNVGVGEFEFTDCKKD